MVSGVVKCPALRHQHHQHPVPTPSPSHPLEELLLIVDGLGLSLINEMYDNVISLIEWHSLMVLCDFD